MTTVEKSCCKEPKSVTIFNLFTFLGAVINLSEAKYSLKLITDGIKSARKN